MSLELFPEFYCDRVFLGWQQPLLRSAVKHLVMRSAEQLDLSQWICVLPSSQSVLRFRQILEEESAGLRIAQPEIIPIGELAERLYEPRRPLAIEFEQTLAWVSVLRNHHPADLAPILPVAPESDSVGPWLEVASTLRRLESDLAAYGLSFGDVLRFADNDNEKRRWELLGRLFDAYQSQLARAGLSDQHAERRAAIERKAIRSDRSVMLIGTSDISEAIAGLLGEMNRDVVALIAAPESERSRFDWLGRFKTESFSDWELPLDDSQLVSAADIGDQAEAVAETVSQWSERHSTGDVATGVTDESHVAPIEVHLRGCGMSTYRHLGWTVSATAVGRFLDALSQLLSRPTWQSLAALVRHGDVHRYLMTRLSDDKSGEASDAEDYLVELDQLLANHFPVHLRDPLPPEAVQRYGRAVKLKSIVDEWLGPLLDLSRDAETDATTASWCEPLVEVLETVFGEIRGETEDASREITRSAAEKVRELLLRFAALNETLDVKISASAALELLSNRVADLRVGRELKPEDSQIHGWLDLSLDDSPAMVVCGLNHPFVPAAVTADAFLPGQLRSQLRMTDNDRRYARDVYAMQLMLATRNDIRFIVGKTAADRSPTPPSRLIAAAKPEAIARRIRLLAQGERPDFTVTHRWDRGDQPSRLLVPAISVDRCPIDSISVTAFRSYLECPYRFYLRHVLKLKPLDDDSSELAANQFGDLVHSAVERFGESPEKDSKDQHTIFEALKHHLHEYADGNFDERVQSAVRLQIHQAERRLRFVAREQAKRIAQGWRIIHTEKAIDNASVSVGTRKLGLRGRIDRIDHNIHTGDYAILDYKTHGHKPEKKHLRWDMETRTSRWIDLQLPLYRLFVPHLELDAAPEEVQLGYFNISDKPTETRVNIANFSEGQMREADRLIHEVVKRILDCDFVPTTDRVPFDDYEMILQTRVASRLLERQTELELEEDAHEYADD